MMPKARTGSMFFNNHVRGQAPKNALALIDFLFEKQKEYA